MTTPTTQPAKAKTGPSPWERQPGEGPKPFHAWTTFRDMGDKRSVRNVARKLDKSATVIGKWSSRWRWQERLIAWHGETERVQAAAMEEEGRRRAKLWADREQKAREDQYQLGQQLLTKAREMLAMPIKRRTSKCNGKVTVLEPVGFNLGQASRVSEVGQKLVNLSVGAPTERTALTGRDGEAVVAGAGAATVMIYLPAKDKDQRAAEVKPVATPPAAKP